LCYVINKTSSYRSLKTFEHKSTE